GEIEQTRVAQHFPSNHRVVSRKNVTCPKQGELRRQRSSADFVGNTGRNLNAELHQSPQVQLDQVWLDLVIVVDEQDVIAARHLKSGVARGALTRFILVNHSQRQITKLLKQVLLASVGGSLIHDDNLQRPDGLPTQLPEQYAEVGITVYGGDQHADAWSGCAGRWEMGVRR